MAAPRSDDLTVPRGARTRRLLLGLLAAGLVWLAAGVRRIDPATELAVLDGPLLGGGARRVESSWTLAPPGLLRLTRYPRVGVELPLPSAAEAQLPGPDGGKLGLAGFATLRVREESWSTLHRAAGDRGLGGALVDALRRAAPELSPGPLSAAHAAGLEERLRRELDAVGVELRRLQVDRVVRLTESGETGPTADARLLVVGLDGADWAVIDPLIERGRMPNLRGLIERGVRAKLLTISPMLSPVIWTTVATGVEPSRHGVLDFLVDAPAGGARQPVTSAQRRVPTVWEMLSRSGVEVGVIGWWATWPADAVRGYLVSDRIAYQLFGYRSNPADARGKTWPPDLYEELRSHVVSPEEVSWDEVRPYLGGTRTRPEQFSGEEREMLDELRTLLASGRSYMGLWQELSRRFEPRLDVVYFEGTDTIGHLFMPYRPPLREGVSPERAASFGAAVDRYYETADAFLGELLRDRGAEWTVLVLSDHGFATDATRPRTTDSRIGHGGAADWHRRFGILVLAGAHVTPGAPLAEASVYDVAPTILALFGHPVPESWPGKVLAQALAPEHLARHPVRYAAADPERASSEDAPSLDPAAADLIEKLRSLGYVSGDANAGGAGSVTAHNNAGVAWMAEGRYADAERELRAGLAQAPDSPMLVLNLAVTLRLAGRPDEALPLLERALESPATERVAGHVLAELKLERGDDTGAEALLRRVLEREPDAAELHNLLGWTLERRGRVEDARGEYERAAALDPDAAMPRNNLGNLARAAGRDDLAESWYLRAIEADPYFMAAYNNLALVYQERGEMDRAGDLYERALAKAPENAELMNNVGSWHFTRGDTTEAARLWKLAVERDPRYPSPLNNLAGLAIVEQRWNDAEKLLRRALALAPGYGDARINLALVHQARGESDDARAELRRATEDRAAAPKAWAQLGVLELGAGRPREAAAAFERATALVPGDYALWNALAEAWRQAGDPGQAAQSVRRSLEINPQQPELQERLKALESAR